MLRAAIIGIGGMGSGHLDNFLRMKKEGKVINLVAVCDIDENKFKNNKKIEGNLEGVGGGGGVDFSQIATYTNADEMLAKENLDFVAIALPTYLHCEYTKKALNAGANVFCEKPMALNAAQCQDMIDTAKKNNKQLMIGQCLRFWGQYEEAKKIIDENKFGKPVAGWFFRGGSTPAWSFENWYLRRECGGGAILDQHVHDVDAINFFYGMPKAVSSLGKIIFPGSGYDTVTTQYYYDDCKAITAQNDWAITHFGFDMVFRLNFERGSLEMTHRGFIANTRGEKATDKCGEVYKVPFDGESAYYKEILYFADCIVNNKPNTVNPPEDSMNTIKIVTAEIASADNGGALTKV